MATYVVPAPPTIPLSVAPAPLPPATLTPIVCRQTGNPRFPLVRPY